MAKRGRKPKEEKKNYFSEREEQAVIDYNATDDAETKNAIYETILKPAFIKMIESIIRRYKLYGPEEDFEETFNDTLSFVVTKIKCYNPERGTKAYSYCGTVAKNYLIQKVNQYQKKIQRNTSYEDVAESVNNNIQYSDEEDTFANTARELVKEMGPIIQMALNDTENNNFSSNEQKLGRALCILLNDWENILGDIYTKSSNKLNKSSILYFLREETRLGTKEIRDGMKKFKQIYLKTKRKMIN